MADREPKGFKFTQRAEPLISAPRYSERLNASKASVGRFLEGIGHKLSPLIRPETGGAFVMGAATRWLVTQGLDIDPASADRILAGAMGVSLGLSVLTISVEGMGLIKSNSFVSKIARKVAIGAVFATAGMAAEGAWHSNLFSSSEQKPTTEQPSTDHGNYRPGGHEIVEDSGLGAGAGDANATGGNSDRGLEGASNANTGDPPEVDLPKVAPDNAAVAGNVGGEQLASPTISDSEVSGSVAGGDLSFEGEPWKIVQNGENNIRTLVNHLGQGGSFTIDHDMLVRKLDESVKLWREGKLSDEELRKLFHLSNGTRSLYDQLSNINASDTIEVLKKLQVLVKI